jgi:hypothetical protein
MVRSSESVGSIVDSWLNSNPNSHWDTASIATVRRSKERLGLSLQLGVAARKGHGSTGLLPLTGWVVSGFAIAITSRGGSRTANPAAS